MESVPVRGMDRNTFVKTALGGLFGKKEVFIDENVQKFIDNLPKSR